MIIFLRCLEVTCTVFRDLAVRISELFGHLVWGTIVTGGAILFLVGGLSLWIAGLVRRRIRATADALKGLSQGDGDLTRRFSLTTGTAK